MAKERAQVRCDYCEKWLDKTLKTTSSLYPSLPVGWLELEIETRNAFPDKKGFCSVDCLRNALSALKVKR